MDGSLTRRTAQFRQQHAEIVEVVQDITFFIRETSVVNDIPEIVSLLIRLSGKLKVHLAMEDSSLYPDMLNSSNEKAVETAQAFQEEMGGLAKAFLDYMSNWRSPDSIADNPEGFKVATAGLFEALGDRVQRENSDLYRLADEL